MKNRIINFLAVIALLASCSPAAEKKVKTGDSTVIKADKVHISGPKKENRPKADVPGDFSALIPIDLLDSKSTNGYEKYGIEFSGNCYACDLASLSITNKKMLWINVCEENDTFEINGFSVSEEGNKTILKTSERTYIITEIDKAPVYELVVEGPKLELDNKRISRFFTTKKALPLFKEHDCGDFEG